MKYITTIFFFILSLKSYSQSIDKIVSDISTYQIDSFSKTLDSSYVYDVTTSSTFNIDTIKLSSGDFIMFTISVTAIQTNGTSIFRTMYLSYNSVNNIAGSYFLKTTQSVLVAGISGLVVTPQLINGNTMCVVKITLPNKSVKIHYRRQEI
jgi:hypothetical protein